MNAGLILRLLRHLRDIQSENGCDLIGQETNDLMWNVATHFGFRPKRIKHPPSEICPIAEYHNFSECGEELVPLDFERSKVRGGAT